MNILLPFAEQLAASSLNEANYKVIASQDHQATINGVAGVGELFSLAYEKNGQQQQVVGIVTANPNKSSATLLLSAPLDVVLLSAVVATRLELDLA